MGGCPGSMARKIERPLRSPGSGTKSPQAAPVDSNASVSELQQWPVQISLVNPSAAFFQDAHLLVAADCTAFAYARFHQDFIRGRITVIGCPKLDDNRPLRREPRPGSRRTACHPFLHRRRPTARAAQVNSSPLSRRSRRSRRRSRSNNRRSLLRPRRLRSLHPINLSSPSTCRMRRIRHR